jgi:hypothetical protein
VCSGTSSCANETLKTEFFSSNSYLSSGAGSLFFNMTNIRANIKFYYFTGGVAFPEVVTSSSQIVSFSNINEPIKNRIVATGNPNIYQLLWSTANATYPYLKWGLSSSDYVSTVNATMRWINESMLCGPPANTTGYYDLGTINIANIEGIVDNNLQNLDIYYVFGDYQLNTRSKEFVFHVPPNAGSSPPSRPTTVALLADLGVGITDSSFGNVWDEPCPPALNTSYSIAALAEAGEIDAIIHTGDISYANGYLTTWDFFLNMISPMAGRSLYFTTVGNHESDYPNTSSYYNGTDSGGECTVVTGTLLPLPAPATFTAPYWSYDIGIIHFIGMSTEHNFTIGSSQYHWLENDLKAVNRSLTPWVLFTGHRPMYADSNYCCQKGSDVNVMVALQANIEYLLYKYQVNLAFSGHFHDLERQSAIYQNKTVQASKRVVTTDGEVVHYYDSPNATVWMLIGSAGNGPDYVDRNYSWSEAAWDNTFGYAIVSAINATTLSWKLINSKNNAVLDQVVITQDFSAWSPSTSDDDFSSSFSSSSSTDIGLIVGVTIGVVAFVALVAFAVVYLRYPQYLTRRKQPMASASDANIEI